MLPRSTKAERTHGCGGKERCCEDRSVDLFQIKRSGLPLWDSGGGSLFESRPCLGIIFASETFYCYALSSICCLLFILNGYIRVVLLAGYSDKWIGGWLDIVFLLHYACISAMIILLT